MARKRARESPESPNPTKRVYDFVKEKPIHPSEREINSSSSKIKTAKQKLSLLQLLSDGKFILSQL